MPDMLAPASNNSSQDSLKPLAPTPVRHSWHGEDVLAHPSPRRLSTASMPVRPRTRSSSSQRVGSIIMDILPGKVVVPARNHTYPTSTVSARAKHAVPASGSGTAKASPLGPSTPTLFAQPKPQLALPTVQVPSTPPNTLAAPRVVVVNPTPHPTPPATPHPSHTARTTSAAGAAPSPTHLAAPVRPVLTVCQPAPPVPAVAPAASTPSAPASGAPSKHDAPGAAAANPEGRSAARPHVLAPSPAVPSRGDETLKPSDRRFFLQAAGSPDRDSPERPPDSPVEGASKGKGRAADVPEPSPTNSATSSNMRSDAPAPKRTMSKPNVRRGKDLPRFTTVRTASGRAQAQRQAAQRRATTEPKKTTFNIGSASSNGTSRDGRSGPSVRAPSPKPSQAAAKPRPPSPPKPAPPTTAVVRKGLVMSTSSEYTTDSDDDSEWASEDASTHSADDRDREKKERERLREETRLREAAEEAQRQRDLFAKVPKRSYSNLNRTKSGLLSQLLNPDPNLFPPNHPYRTYSTQDMTQLGRQGGRLPQPNALSSRSSAAVPLVTQLTPLTALAQTQVTPATSSPQASASQGYRPKGRPQGAEMEDDSDSDDDQDNGIQLSRSLAQQKLAALAGPSRRRTSDQAAAPPRQQPQPQPQQQPAPPQRPPLAQASSSALTVTAPTVAAAAATAAPTPIPLGHPYNLPAPAPPMTPRTTRRQMLATELSESLRRNLLWERQVSKMNMTSGVRRSGLPSRIAPLTPANGQQQQGQQQGNAPVDEREERRRAAVARNRSWADEYHYAGW